MSYTPHDCHYGKNCQKADYYKERLAEKDAEIERLNAWWEKQYEGQRNRYDEVISDMCSKIGAQGKDKGNNGKTEETQLGRGDNHEHSKRQRRLVCCGIIWGTPGGRGTAYFESWCRRDEQRKERERPAIEARRVARAVLNPGPGPGWVDDGRGWLARNGEIFPGYNGPGNGTRDWGGPRGGQGA